MERLGVELAQGYLYGRPAPPGVGDSRYSTWTTMFMAAWNRQVTS
jgi:EAL domain-containing protein (putative c-di-GMP-specific phosphodiesterase class I)